MLSSFLVLADDLQLVGQINKACRTLETVSRSLAAMVDDRRQTFPRLYFCSDSEVHALMGQVGPRERPSIGLRLCFPGLHDLVYDDDGCIAGVLPDPVTKQVVRLRGRNLFCFVCCNIALRQRPPVTPAGGDDTTAGGCES